MLAVHILNVGHGDSIVLEYRPAAGSPAFAVIDSNRRAGEAPRALTKLKALGATALSFAAVTHPHADHYLGMAEILAHFNGKIDRFYSFPLEKADRKKLAAAAAKIADETDSASVGRMVLELVALIVEGSKIPEWITESSITHRLAAPGFGPIEFHQVLPPSKLKGRFFQQLEQGNVDFGSPNQNEISLALLVKYRGVNLVLGGDGTQENWRYQAGRWEHIDFSLNAAVAKLPHHGSATDSSPAVLKVIYGEEQASPGGQLACISADGRSHPDNSVLDEIARRGLKPYCTNLAVRCGATRRIKIAAGECDPELGRFIETVAVSSSDRQVQPCQGDITLVISDQGQLSVQTQYNHPCPFRGDFEAIFPGTALQ